MRMVAALVWMRVPAKLMRTRPTSGWCGGADANGEDKMSLSFLFLFFGETVYAIKGSGPVDGSAAQLATSRLTDAGRSPVVEH
jgi:hypothetical protein